MSAAGRPASSRRALLQQMAALSVWAAAPGLHAQPGGGGFPRRPITLWVPWPAGGATDLMMRLLAELAGEHLGQQVIVKNRPGAGGTLVMPVLQQAAPDGYTIAQLPHPVFRMPHVQKVLWDPIRDTSPIIQISGVTFGMVVPAGSPFRSFSEVLAFASARPGELTISTNGTGTTPHVVLEELLTRRGLNYIHMPYKGTAEQMVAVASDQVMVGVNSTGFVPFVDSGQLRLLVTFGPTRTKRWPQVPTLKELGTTSWRCRLMGWSGHAVWMRSLCGPCTMRSKRPCSTRRTWPSWPSMTRNWPTSIALTMRAPCVKPLRLNARPPVSWLNLPHRGRGELASMRRGVGRFAQQVNVVGPQSVIKHLLL